jgi:glycosyltransferase involved in cell wall biosynthesis
MLTSPHHASDASGRRPTLLYVATVADTLRFLSGQIRYMRRMGFDVQAMSSPGEGLEGFGRRDDVVVHGVDMARRITPLRDLRAVWQMRRELSRIRPTIIHGMTPKGGLLAMLGASLSRVPIRIYHILGLPLLTAGKLRKTLLRLTERTSCALADQVFCLSHSLQEVVVAERLCPAGKVKVLAGGSIKGVDADDRFNPGRLAPDARRRSRERYNIPQDALVVGFVGRIVRDKGIVELVEAWRKLREEFPHLHLLVVGPFEPHDPVPAEIDAVLRDDPRIHLTGLEWDTPPLYAAMDLLVLPTYREGFGEVLLEGAAMNLPVVATRVPGCSDAVADGQTGILVPARDAGALADAMRTYITNLNLREEHAHAGRQRVLRDFRPEVLWRTLYDEYVRLLRQRRMAAPKPHQSEPARTEEGDPAPRVADRAAMTVWTRHHQKTSTPRREPVLAPSPGIFGSLFAKS